MEVQFDGYNITPKFLKTDKSWRIEIETSKDQVENINAILKGLPEGIYEVVIRAKAD